VRGIELLVERGLEVRGKAVLLAPLVPEAGRLRELARSLGIGVHLDARVDPTLSGDRSPLALRADPQQAVAAELDDPDRVEQLLLAHRMQLLRDRSQAATPCGAGHSTFHLDPAGRLMPCMLVREPGIDASVQGFEAAWQELGEHERVAFSPDSPCRHCQIQYLCSHCPGLERLDVTARPNQAYHECELARLRARVLEQMLDDHLRLEGADERPPR